MLNLVPLIVLLLGLVLFLIPWPPSAAKLGSVGFCGMWPGLAFVLAQAVVSGVAHLPH